MKEHDIFIGLMSGTSLDGIDAVAVRFAPTFELLGSCSCELPSTVRDQILTLCTPGNDEIDRMGKLDQTLAQLFADAALKLMATLNLSADQVTAIGSHGQTIRHRPEHGFTLQIGNPNLISELTGITTVADFRPRDIAAGGEGAPLVPAFHKALFSDRQHPRIVLNIGGMSNITWLPADQSQIVMGYDTGPGNVLLDGWISAQQQRSYDADGCWAAQGNVDAQLLDQLLSLPYFSKPAPKSTGREQFNMAWLQEQMTLCSCTSAPQDVQATLLELTARTISDQIRTFLAEGVSGIFVCGGGSHNQTLLKRLSQLLSPIKVNTTDALGLHPDWVEACAFAWLAKQTLSGLSGNLPDVTGARGERILGAIYPA